MKDHNSSDAQSPYPLTCSEIESSSYPSALKFDPRAYSHFLEETGWTEAQKYAFTKALWEIVVGFVDLGFNLHPLQHLDNTKSLDVDSPSMVSWPDISNDENARTLVPSDGAVERIDS
jgi:hypothetical protein